MSAQVISDQFVKRQLPQKTKKKNWKKDKKIYLDGKAEKYSLAADPELPDHRVGNS